MGAGVPVESYSTDNGIYNSREFSRDMHDKYQGIRNSRGGGNHYNGVVENKINNVVRIYRNMMINAALMCPDDS